MDNSHFININIPEDRQKLYSELKEKHNPEGSELRVYQHHLTKTLIAFDDFCREHDIKYSLAFGTMLGAVRHKGFIPWDDDADLYMDRDNYEKLHVLMKGPYHELTPELSVAMGIRPELWSPPFAYIDVFILDKSPDCLVLKLIKQIAAIFVYCCAKCRGRIDSKDIKTWKIIRPWYFFIPFALLCSQNRWKEHMTNVAGWFSNAKSSYLQSYNNTVKGIRRKYRTSDCRDYDSIIFEEHVFPVFKGFDTILKIHYGNYMELPAKLHINHVVEILKERESEYYNKTK